MIELYYRGRRLNNGKIVYCYSLTETDETILFAKKLAKFETTGQKIQSTSYEDGKVTGPHKTLPVYALDDAVTEWSLLEAAAVERHKLNSLGKHSQHIDELIKVVRESE